ncbi:MAG: trehalose-phosphatase [Candidatus Makaraimicrobium thalassicum]|nr:MAG: trehalose-phosphatase [Candidatus Omnitrophota bacterium]
MRHLIKEWKRITGEIKDGYLYLFLDFDGTLAPIRKHPREVKLGRGIYNVLKKLAGADNVSVAIISGRKLSEVKRIAGLKGIMYVGNHGLEAAGPGMDFKLPSAIKAQKTISVLRRKLRERLRCFKGVLVEDKGLTLSVHYRMADKKNWEKIARICMTAAEPYRKQRKIRITAGKKVWEIRPPAAWDKGRMAEKLLNRKKRELKRKVIPFCMGDDRTDEDVFRRFKNTGYTVKITKKNREASMADYYLRNVREVSFFLREIYSLRRRA